MTQTNVEIIPENSFDEIVLRVEEIPPLDVFYSPMLKAVIKRQRKKEKTRSIFFFTYTDGDN